MNVLLFVEPLVMHNRPFHYWAWLGFYAGMARAVEAAGGEVRVVVNEALAVRATAPCGSGRNATERGHGLPPERVVALAQMPIRRLFNRPNTDILACLLRGTEPAATQAYGELLRRSLGDFVPDVMLTLSPAPQLQSAFPEALLLMTESAAYSRDPFPQSIFFDPSGWWECSLLCAPAADFAPTAEERALLASFRARYAAYLRATSPFHALETELRQRYARIAFLPLQFGGEGGFDLNGPFRNQGEYLWHVIEQLPPDVALLVVEHPTAHWVGDIIDDETRQYLAERHPQVHFIDFRAADSAGHYLVHHADFVIGLSTSLALQALLFDKPVVAVGHSHVRHLAATSDLATLGEGLPPRSAIDDRLAFMLSRYFVPLEFTQRPDWLMPFLSRCLERARRGVKGTAFLDPVAPVEVLAQHLFRALSHPPLGARLENGDLTDWPRGAGPFFAGQHGPEGWQLLDFGGGIVKLAARGEGEGEALRGLRLERVQPGSEATLLLQRVPDLRRSAGSLARLRFRMRGAPDSLLLTYFYAQFGDGREGEGTALRLHVVTDAWQEFEHTAVLPALGDRALGEGHHLEVVFAIPREAGPVAVELTDVALEPLGG